MDFLNINISLLSLQCPSESMNRILMQFKDSFINIQPKLSKETDRILNITLSNLESVFKRHTSSVVALLMSLYFIFVNNFKRIFNIIQNVIRHTVYRFFLPLKEIYCRQ